MRSWGEGVFANAHGIFIDFNDVVWCADNEDHTVRKFTTNGEPRQTLGNLNQPSDTGMSNPRDYRTIRYGGPPFNRCTRLAVAPSGELFVSDGYGNARVHKFSAAGELIKSWGEPGTGPGQFNLVHSVWVDKRGIVYVCDRENDRVQLFDGEGTYLDAWTRYARPMDIYIDSGDHVYLCCGGLYPGERGDQRRLPSVVVANLKGQPITQWGNEDPTAPGSFFAPHGLWVDSRGDIYVGEVKVTAGRNRGIDTSDCHAFQKFVRTRSSVLGSS